MDDWLMLFRYSSVERKSILVPWGHLFSRKQVMKAVSDISKLGMARKRTMFCTFVLVDTRQGLHSKPKD